MHRSKHIIYLFTIFLTIACSPENNGPKQAGIDDLVGLWNSSENADVMYTRVTANGGILEYDYDGDAVDQGLSCYQIESGSIKHIEDNRFLVMTDMHGNKQFEVELELLDAGYALKVVFLPDDDTTGANNSIRAGQSQIWTREPDTSKFDQEPPCK